MLAFRYIATFRGSAKFSTWPFRIASNNALMKLRQANARIVEVPFDDFTEDGTDNPDHLGKLDHRLRRSYHFVDHIQLERARSRCSHRVQDRVLFA